MGKACVGGRGGEQGEKKAPPEGAPLITKCYINF